MEGFGSLPSTVSFLLHKGQGCPRLLSTGPGSVQPRPVGHPSSVGLGLRAELPGPTRRGDSRLTHSTGQSALFPCVLISLRLAHGGISQGWEGDTLWHPEVRGDMPSRPPAACALIWHSPPLSAGCLLRTPAPRAPGFLPSCSRTRRKCWRARGPGADLSR